MRSSISAANSPVRCAGGGDDRRRSRALIEIAKIGRRQRDGAIGIDVAGNRQRGVARLVVGLKKLADVIEPRGLDVLGSANGHPVIRMIGWIQRRDERHPGEAVRTILVVLPPLVEDDVALVFELASVRAGSR